MKPFRTLEDVYVLSAMTAWLYGVGHDSDWPQALQLRLLALLALSGWRLGGWRLATLTLVLGGFVAATGLWEQAMITVYLCGVSVVMACKISAPTSSAGVALEIPAA